MPIDEPGPDEGPKEPKADILATLNMFIWTDGKCEAVWHIVNPDEHGLFEVKNGQAFNFMVPNIDTGKVSSIQGTYQEV